MSNGPMTVSQLAERKQGGVYITDGGSTLTFDELGKPHLKSDAILRPTSRPKQFEEPEILIGFERTEEGEGLVVYLKSTLLLFDGRAMYNPQDDLPVLYLRIGWASALGKVARIQDGVCYAPLRYLEHGSLIKWWIPGDELAANEDGVVRHAYLNGIEAQTEKASGFVQVRSGWNTVGAPELFVRLGRGIRAHWYPLRSH